MINNFDIAEFKKKTIEFHGSTAPGLLIGAFMVNLAKELLPSQRFYDVISESAKCLPDSVQLLTPCSIGNGWLKIIDTGRFAVIFYDKETKEGLRIYVDSEKIKLYPEIYNWFFKIVPKREQNTELLIEQITTAKSAILSTQKVQALGIKPKVKGTKIMICSQCNEGYPLCGEDGESSENICINCKGNNPFYKTIN